MELKELLKEVKLFSFLTHQEIEEISKLAKKRRYEKDEIILRETEFGNAFYLIAKGSVKVSIYSEEGEETILTFLGVGDFFGEMALFLDSIRCANVISLEETEVFILERQDFYEILKNNFNMTKKIFEVLCSRLRQANFFIDSLAHLDVSGRLIRFFQEISKEKGQDEGEYVSIPRFSQQDLAGKIASTRETISRILANMKNAGLIEFKKDRFLINKKLIK